MFVMYHATDPDCSLSPAGFPFRVAERGPARAPRVIFPRDFGPGGRALSPARRAGAVRRGAAGAPAHLFGDAGLPDVDRSPREPRLADVGRLGATDHDAGAPRQAARGARGLSRLLGDDAGPAFAAARLPHHRNGCARVAATRDRT